MTFLVENILYFIFAFNILSFIFCGVVLVSNILTYVKLTKPEREAKKAKKKQIKKQIKEMKTEQEKVERLIKGDK